jgi:hypothetical protein
MLALGGASMATWVLMMFGPATTVLHHGSYAAVILLWVGLSGVAVRASGRWSATIVAFQVVFFTAVWARNLPGPDVAVHAGHAAVAAMAGVVVLAVLASVARSDSDGTAEPEREPFAAGRLDDASPVPPAALAR